MLSYAANASTPLLPEHNPTQKNVFSICYFIINWVKQTSLTTFGETSLLESEFWKSPKTDKNRWLLTLISTFWQKGFTKVSRQLIPLKPYYTLTRCLIKRTQVVHQPWAQTDVNCKHNEERGLGEDGFLV